MGKKIIVSVISDLVTDQRVQKECGTLHRLGFEVLLIGRKSKRNFILSELPFKTIRFHNLFRRGPGMYLIFNFQLMVYLLFKKGDILWSNDLDTLLPNYIISRLKKTRLIYDSHEYFTESVYKNFSKKLWEKLENILFPRLRNVITVNDSIRAIYENKYKVPVTVIRNVPYRYRPHTGNAVPVMDPDKRILVMQGMGLNENRGAEELVMAMQYLPEHFHLFFIGSGTVLDKLKGMVGDLRLAMKVTFVDALPYPDMMEYTRQCFLGLILEKTDITGEHLLALPNRLFDYVQAGIPILSTKAVEIEKVIKKFKIGDLISRPEPEEIARKIVAISADRETYTTWKLNTQAAAEELIWENEEKILVQFMQKIA